MSRLVARILLAILIVPLAAMVFVMSMVLLVRGGPTLGTVVAVWLLTDFVCATYWILLWRPVVRWTQRRVLLTTLSVPAALLFGVVVAVVLRATYGRPSEPMPEMASGAISALAWLVTTVLIWRESPAERAQRHARDGPETVACPVCGYNLTGMRELRCPECGTRFTIDELLRSQPERDRGALAPHE